MKNARLLKYDDIKTEVLESYDVVASANVTLNGVIFDDGIISKIDFIKHIFKDGTDSLFIKLYMGNVTVAMVITNDDYVIEIEEGKHPSFWIRKSKEYDY